MPAANHSTPTIIACRLRFNQMTKQIRRFLSIVNSGMRMQHIKRNTRTFCGSRQHGFTQHNG